MFETLRDIRISCICVCVFWHKMLLIDIWHNTDVHHHSVFNIQLNQTTLAIAWVKQAVKKFKAIQSIRRLTKRKNRFNWKDFKMPSTRSSLMKTRSRAPIMQNVSIVKRKSAKRRSAPPILFDLIASNHSNQASKGSKTSVAREQFNKLVSPEQWVEF